MSKTIEVSSSGFLAPRLSNTTVPWSSWLRRNVACSLTSTNSHMTVVVATIHANTRTSVQARRAPRHDRRLGQGPPDVAVARLFTRHCSSWSGSSVESLSSPSCELIPPPPQRRPLRPRASNSFRFLIFLPAPPDRNGTATRVSISARAPLSRHDFPTQWSNKTALFSLLSLG